MGQRLLRGAWAAQQRQRAATLGQGGGLFIGQSQTGKTLHGGVKRGQRLGQQMQLQIGIGQLLFGDRQVLRHGQGFRALAR